MPLRTNKDTIENWARKTGEQRIGKSVFYKGNAIYLRGRSSSYNNSRPPIATHMKTGKKSWVLMNTDNLRQDGIVINREVRPHIWNSIYWASIDQGLECFYMPLGALGKVTDNIERIKIIDSLFNIPSFTQYFIDMFTGECFLISCGRLKYLVGNDTDTKGKRFVVKVSSRCKTVKEAIEYLMPEEIKNIMKKRGLYIWDKSNTSWHNLMLEGDFFSLGPIFLVKVGKGLIKPRRRFVMQDIKSYDKTVYQAGSGMMIDKTYYVGTYIKNGTMRTEGEINTIRRKIGLMGNIYRVIVGKNLSKAIF